MSLNAPTPGLRPIYNKSKSTEKVTLSVAPGDRLDVSEDIATQLAAASGAFVGEDQAHVAQAAAEAVAAHEAGEDVVVDDPPAEAAPEPVKKVAPEPVKKAAPKKAAAKRTDG